MSVDVKRIFDSVKEEIAASSAPSKAQNSLLQSVVSDTLDLLEYSKGSLALDSVALDQSNRFIRASYNDGQTSIPDFVEIQFLAWKNAAVDVEVTLWNGRNAMNRHTISEDNYEADMSRFAAAISAKLVHSVPARQSTPEAGV